jgi:glutaminyl-peptide cyclotransferase
MSRATMAVFAACALLAGCRRPATPEPVSFTPSDFSGPRALEEVRKFVAPGPKVSGTPGGEKAAQYILARLKSIGLDASIAPFSVPSRSDAAVFRNVIGAIPGRGEGIVILACHYDTKSGISADFAGANDSGSGVGLLLELASDLHRAPRVKPEIMFAFLDGEECMEAYTATDGLQGSRRLAATLKEDGKAGRVIAVIVVDMIGDKDLTVTIPPNSTPELISAVFTAAERESVRPRFSLCAGGILDDHVPFMDAGMRAVDLIDFEYGSAPGKNDYWHTAQDTMDKLSAESLSIVGRVVIRVLNSML